METHQAGETPGLVSFCRQLRYGRIRSGCIQLPLNRLMAESLFSKCRGSHTERSGGGKTRDTAAARGLDRQESSDMIRRRPLTCRVLWFALIPRFPAGDV